MSTDASVVASTESGAPSRTRRMRSVAWRRSPRAASAIAWPNACCKCGGNCADGLTAFRPSSQTASSRSPVGAAMAATGSPTGASRPGPLPQPPARSTAEALRDAGVLGQQCFRCAFAISGQVLADPVELAPPALRIEAEQLVACLVGQLDAFQV